MKMKKYLVNCMAVMLLMSTITACNGNENEPEGVTKHNGHEYVDLGLSVKWATCNVGAALPEDKGGYFAWGEVVSRDSFNYRPDEDWENYKWAFYSYGKFGKYCTDSQFGVVDNKIVLELDDDVAHVVWGGSWRMPTFDEFMELFANSICEVHIMNDVEGVLLTSKLNGNQIFMPCSVIDDYNTLGLYWSSSLAEYSHDAKYLLFDCSTESHTVALLYNNRLLRYAPCNVRPVLP